MQVNDALGGRQRLFEKFVVTAFDAETPWVYYLEVEPPSDVINYGVAYELFEYGYT